jgi:hypothetical protein
MTEKKQRETEAAPAKPQPTAQVAGQQTTAERKLDVAGLDLGIEEVEERIAPAETNVFDK